MLLTRARVVPHCMRARLVSDRGVTTTLPSCTMAPTSLATTSVSVPSLPLAVTVWPATSTVTPCGIGTGCLPTRDMGTSEYAAEDLAADIGGAGLVVRHDASGRRQDRDAEPVVDAGQVGDARGDAPARRGDARDLAYHRLALHRL